MSSSESQAPSDSPSANGVETSHIRRVLKLWLVLSVIFVALTFVVVPLVNPTTASSVAGFANLTDLVFTALAVPVAIFVWVFVFYSVVVFREKAPVSGSAEDLEDGPPLDVKPRQQIWWLGITGGLALTTVAWGMFGFYSQVADSPRDPLVVNVTGQEWTWTYDYPALGVQSHVLELPRGRAIQFRVTSDDVLHGFVIDALGVAMDANPGEWVAAPTVTPTKVGNFDVRCVELCGLYHTYMWSPVKVVSLSGFATWVRANGGTPNAISAQKGTS